MSRLLAGIAGIAYLAAALTYVIAVDANLEGGHGVWLALLAGASLAFGWATGSWAAGLLALALMFVGAPFDYPESRFGEPFPTAVYAQILIPVSAALILLGVGARKVRDRHRKSAQTQDGVTQA